MAPELGNELRESEETQANEADTAEKVSPSDMPSIANYEIARRIGAGGFGTVWLARNHHDHKFYALKTISPGREFELHGIREYQKRIKNHPNLVHINHVGCENGIYYYVMPLADNAIPSNSVQDLDTYEPLTLESYLDRHGELSIKQALDLAEQVVAGLRLIHERGGIHRDIKPANILRIDGRWHLGDPGLMAKSNSKSPTAGTPSFIVSDGPSDYRADLYALGVTITQSVDPTEFTSRSSDSLALQHIVERATSDQPEKQYRSTKEMYRDINRAQNRSNAAIWLLAIAAVLLILFFLWRRDSLGQLKVVQTHISVDTQEGTKVGILGETMDTVGVNQTVHLSLDLDRPAYLCAVAFDTNGTSNLLPEGTWHDSKESRLSFPRSQNSGSAFYALTDGPGVQALAVFAAESIPDETKWRHDLDQISWNHSNWHDAVFWFCEGETIRHFDVKHRGKAIELSPPSEFTALRSQLAALTGVRLIYLAMFQVSSSPNVTTNDSEVRKTDHDGDFFALAEFEQRLSELDFERARQAAEKIRSQQNSNEVAPWKQRFPDALLQEVDRIEALSVPNRKRFRDAFRRQKGLSGVSQDGKPSTLSGMRSITKTQKEVLGKDSLCTLAAWQTYCEHLMLERRDAKHECQELHEHSARVLGNDNPDTLYRKSLLGRSIAENDLVDAIRIQRESAGALKDLAGPFDERTIRAHRWLAENLRRQNHLEEALVSSTLVIEGYRRKGARDSLINPISLHVELLTTLGRGTEAEALLLEELEQNAEEPGAYTRIQRLLDDLGWVQSSLQRPFASLETCERRYELVRARHAKDSLPELHARANVAARLLEVGRIDESIEKMSQIADFVKRTFRPNQFEYQYYVGEFANFLRTAKRFEEADVVLRHLIHDIPLEPSRNQGLRIRFAQVYNLIELKKYTEAEELLSTIEAAAITAFGPNLGPATYEIADCNSLLSVRMGDFAAAQDAITRYFEMTENASRSHVWPLRMREATCLYAIGEVDAAVAIWSKISQELESNLSKDKDQFLNPVTRDIYSCRNILSSVEAERENFKRAFEQIDAFRSPGLRQALQQRYHQGTDATSLASIQTSLNEGDAIVGWVDTKFSDSQHIPNLSWVYVLRRQGDPEFFRVAELEANEVSMLMDLLRDPSSDLNETTKACQDFYRKRFAGTSKALGETNGLPAAQRLIVVAGGRMSGIPWQAILDIADPKRPYLVSQTPSPSIYALIANSRETHRRDRRALVISNPSGDLKYAQESGKRVASYYEPTTSLMSGVEVREQQIQQFATSSELRKFSVIHFAGHVLEMTNPFETAMDLRAASPEVPLVERVVSNLLEDDLIPAQQIAATWDLDADVFVVAGCSSNKGAISPSDGFLGLTHALLKVGAKTTVVSQWPVSDHATGLLMDRFHQNLSGKLNPQKSMNATESMAEAKSWLRKLKFDELVKILKPSEVDRIRGKVIYREASKTSSAQIFAHPYYWAGFSIVGGP